MTVLVTGGMGFIGGHVVRALLEQRTDVVTVDVAAEHNQAHLVLTEDELARIVALAGDVADTAFLLRVVREHDVDRLVHLVHAADATGRNPAFEVRANTQAFLNVLEAARIFGLERVVWASSSAVFGSAARHAGPVGRDAPHWPRIPYEAYKSHNEAIGDHYARTFGVTSIALRFNYVYGYGRRSLPDRPGFDRGLFLDPARGEVGKVPFADGVGLWQYVGDTVGTVLAALAAPAGVQGAFNTCGSVVAVRDIADMVKERLPEARFELMPGEMDFVHDIDDSETQAALGYRQRFDMQEGVDATLAAIAAAA
jgi:nucleoside-diphosphate-sugar epimerase